jgi:sulfide-dependent adenosine diphosphate thiazole synthase
MWSEIGECLAVMQLRKSILANYYIMATNAATCTPKMGHVFGSMLLSGEKAAKLALEKLKEL